MNVAFENCLSVNEAADILGLTTGRIRQLLLAGQLPGKKLTERSWVIDRRELVRFSQKTGRNTAKSGR